MTSLLFFYGSVNDCLSDVLLLIFILYLIQIVSQWILFNKAGENGWASIIPIYNQYVFCDIVWDRPLYFLINYIPVVGFIFNLVTFFKLAECFNKGAGFGFGLVLIPEVFMAILAFGKSEYNFDRY